MLSSNAFSYEYIMVENQIDYSLLNNWSQPQTMENKSKQIAEQRNGSKVTLS